MMMNEPYVVYLFWW